MVLCGCILILIIIDYIIKYIYYIGTKYQYLLKYRFFVKINLSKFCYDFRYEDVSTVMVRNSHLDLMDQDILYHLALGSGSHDLRAMFGDVKVWF